MTFYHRRIAIRPCRCRHIFLTVTHVDYFATFISSNFCEEMKKCSIVFLVLVLALSACKSRETALVFVESTDTHGCFDGFANDAALIRHLRDSIGDKAIFADNGDNLQGTVFQYCSNHDAAHPNLNSDFLDYFPYDVAGVGNHDIEAGRKVFERTYAETSVPVVCANVIDESTGEPYFKPYMVIKRDGFKVAVLGLLTPYVVTWVPERLRPGLRFDQIESSAAKWVSIIREKEHPDLMVGLFHSGWEPVNGATADSVLGLENATKWVAENIPGFDIIMYGHDHRKKVDSLLCKNGNMVYVMNSGSRAQGLAIADVTLKQGKKPSVKLEWIATKSQPVDSAFASMVQPYLDRADAYQSREVAQLPVDISSNDALKGSCLWVDEIHRCQFDAAAAAGVHADISIAAPLGRDKTLKAGMLTVKDFFTWYPFENSLAVLSMTGAEVKRFLEYAYTMKNPIYNFDSGAGIIYEVDESKPDGERIRIISMADGTPFEPNKTYLVVMNSYRSMGGGGHLMNGVGWSQSEIKNHVVWQNDMDLRSVFIEWASKKQILDAEPLNQWKINN